MRPAAWTRIVITDAYDADRIARALREPLKIELLFCVVPCQEGLSHREIGENHVIDLPLDRRDLLVRQISVEMVVALRFSLLDVSAK